MIIKNTLKLQNKKVILLVNKGININDEKQLKHILHILKNTANYWAYTQVVLRDYFELTYKNSCKNCNSCCCNECKENIGYFRKFDYLMFYLNKWIIPKPKNKTYLTKKGCSLNKYKRSLICLFYSCKNDNLKELLKHKWNIISSYLIDEKIDYHNISSANYCELLNDIKALNNIIHDRNQEITK